MKTNALRNKKPGMARAAFRCYLDRWPWDNWYPQSIIRWHRAAKGKHQ